MQACLCLDCFAFVHGLILEWPLEQVIPRKVQGKFPCQLAMDGKPPYSVGDFHLGLFVHDVGPGNV